MSTPIPEFVACAQHHRYRSRRLDQRGGVEVVISVEVGERNLRGLRAGAAIDSRCKRPIAVPKQYGEGGRHGIGNDQVESPVTVHVADRDRLGRVPRSVAHRRRERAVAVAEEDEDGAGAGHAHREVGNRVPVEITDRGAGTRRRRCREIQARSETAIALAQQDGELAAILREDIELRVPIEVLERYELPADSGLVEMRPSLEQLDCQSRWWSRDRAGRGNHDREPPTAV